MRHDGIRWDESSAKSHLYDLNIMIISEASCQIDDIPLNNYFHSHHHSQSFQKPFDRSNHLLRLLLLHPMSSLIDQR